jgi:hypothetical protein
MLFVWMDSSFWRQTPERAGCCPLAQVLRHYREGTKNEKFRLLLALNTISLPWSRTAPSRRLFRDIEYLVLAVNRWMRSIPGVDPLLPVASVCSEEAGFFFI